MKTLTVVKIGGNVIDNPKALESFVDDFSRLSSPKILVHGGGKLATRLCERLDIPVQMIEGRRVTDKETLDVATMVYAGLVNKKLVAKLQQRGCNAIGLSGADLCLLPAVKRSSVPVDYGYVGDIITDNVNTGALCSLLDMGAVPVFCALSYDGNGTLLNSNADGVASALAVAMSARQAVDLVYCFELPGVMRDISDSESWIPEINEDSYARLREEGIVQKGMIPKIDNAFAALRQGVRCVVIKSSADIAAKRGTIIRIH